LRLRVFAVKKKTEFVFLQYFTEKIILFTTIVT